MLRQDWRHVAFLHWQFEPDLVQALLPEGLEVDTFDGTAWVGLTPFLVLRSRPALLPPVPAVSNFPETNLRTYVVGPDGRDGLWFLTIEAGSLSTTAGARALLHVPYHWADMAVVRTGSSTTYTSQRRADPAADHRTTVEVGGEVTAHRQLAEWLTGRWRAWIRPWGRLATVAVRHEPWPLVGSRLVDHEDGLLKSCGLPRPTAPPLVFASPGVNASLGWPQLSRPQTISTEESGQI